MADLNALKQANVRRWANAKLTRSSEFTPVAKRLVSFKERYQVVAKQTGVPWQFIAVAHQRESSANFSKSLAQGDPWNAKSVHVPAGRGPFNSWEEAAVDALVACAPFAARNTDWSIGGTLTMLERYNGLGYANKGLPSPYIWSGTDQYVKGKYIRDGVFDANVVDKQLGCAGLLLAMIALDPTITFGASLTAATQKPAAIPATPATTPVDHAKVGGAVVATTAAAGAAAASQAGVSTLEIIAWIGGLSVVAIAAFIIGFRITKGHWPWTSISTGNRSPELSPPSHQPSAASLALASVQLGLPSAELPATPSQPPSTPTRRRKQSAKPSPRTRTPRASSKTSKRSAVKKSSPKRKSRSKS